MKKRICVDLNGVLDTYTGWRGEVTWHAPREGAREFLAALCDRGHEVVVLTTREPGEAAAWLARHGLDRFVSRVTDRKLPALAYVDDRAVSFRGDFDQTLSALERFRPFWEPESPPEPTAGDAAEPARETAQAREGGRGEAA